MKKQKSRAEILDAQNLNNSLSEIQKLVTPKDLEAYQEMMEKGGKGMDATSFGRQVSKNLSAQKNARKINPKYYSFDKLEEPLLGSPARKHGHLSNFGKFQCLTLNEQRRILASRSEDNKGALLSDNEQKMLSQCLQAQKAPIYTFEEFSDMCRDKYGRGALECKRHVYARVYEYGEMTPELQRKLMRFRQNMMGNAKTQADEIFCFEGIDPDSIPPCLVYPTRPNGELC